MANSDNKTPSSVHDLRSALELLKTLPGEYVETDTKSTRMLNSPASIVT